MIKQLKQWLGILSMRNQLLASPQCDESKIDSKSQKEKIDMDAKTQSNDLVNIIWRVHAALDTVYGKGFSKANPAVVAQFMQAAATQVMADELAALRDIIASGTGGLTIGIENPDGPRA